MNSLVRTAADKMKTISRDGAASRREEAGEGLALRELLQNWELAKNNQPPQKIEPLK